MLDHCAIVLVLGELELLTFVNQSPAVIMYRLEIQRVKLGMKMVGERELPLLDSLRTGTDA